MDYLPVLTKRDFVRRFQRGEFGNRNLVWDTLDEYLESGYKGLIHFRNRIAGGPTIYNVPRERALDLWKEQRGNGDWYFAAMAPHNKNLIQGEVQRTHVGLELWYSTERGLPMRDALGSSGQRAYGIIGVSLLKSLMCPNSYEWLNVLLDRYDGHVVEFSTFSCEWGTIEGFNSVFWEVRLY